MPLVPSSVLVPFVVRPGAPSSFLFLVAMPRAPSSVLLTPFDCLMHYLLLNIIFHTEVP